MGCIARRARHPRRPGIGAGLVLVVGDEFRPSNERAGDLSSVQVRGGVLSLDPRLPTSWHSLELRFRCLGRRIRLLITPDGIDVQTSRPLQVRLADQAPRRVAGRARLVRRAG